MLKFRVGDKIKIYDGTIQEVLAVKISDRGEDDPLLWLKIADRRWVNGDDTEKVV